MSNVTPQIALNKGYTVIAQLEIMANSPAQALTAVPGTNKIIILSDQNTIPVYLGDGSCNDSDGLPIFEIYSYFDGTNPSAFYKPIPIEIVTDTPEDFCLFSNAPGGTVRVLYLALNT